MDIYDAMCFTVASAGGRRGAQMGTFDISHPDVMDFIKAKHKNGRLRQFNLSLLITDQFITAVKEDGDWQLVFPISKNDVNVEKLNFKNSAEVVWREWPTHDKYIVNDDGLVACKVYNVIKARNLWNMIMTSTYDYAEPGFILIDRVNEENNNWFCEVIRATNPCGEQPLPPYGACLLGSVNLTQFVVNPFTEDSYFDYEKYKKVVSIFSRMLDNVVEINNLPLKKQRGEIIRKRRHGMGFLGLGSALTMLQMKYGSSESLAFTEEMSKVMAVEGWRTGLKLSIEKGPAPIMEEKFEVTGAMLRKRPEMIEDGYKVGDKVKGKVLHIKYSRYMQKITKELSEKEVESMLEHGLRYTHHTSIAPTGTISLSLANNASNGIEPSFSHHYLRNVIKPGQKSKAQVDVFSYELLAYRKFVNPDAMPFDKEAPLPEYFTVSDDVSPEQHVRIQAAAQKWIDSSISKTANVPTDYPFENFKDIYMTAYDAGLKGCTTFRFNPEVFSGVLVKEDDLENTLYKFELKNGRVIEVKGNQKIEYDGEIHVAANLFDALKDGYYGKY